MTLSDLGSIASFLSAIAVLATLIYLSRQVKQGNMFARAQSRQWMVEQAQGEFHLWMENATLRACFVKPELAAEEQELLHYFLLSAMRQREWEWFQYKDGVIKEDVYRAYHEVIGLHLGIARTRRWWSTVGRIGFNPAFVAEVDALIADRPTHSYFEDIRRYDTPA
jgi:hypothetical protein